MSHDLMIDIDGDGRVQTWSAIIPTKGTLMDEHHRKVAAALEQFIKQAGHSKTSAARSIGIGGSTLSQFCSGKYTGNSDDIARKVNRWIEQEGRRQDALQKVDYIPTRVAQYMRRTIQAALDSSRMAAIVSPSGTGKSMLLEYMAEQTGGHLIQADPDDTPSSITNRIILAVGGCKIPTGQGIAARRQTIIDRLKGTNQPVFFDEAQNFKANIFPGLRRIYDGAGVSIVFAGSHQILQKVDDRATGEGQFHSRTDSCNVLRHFASMEGDRGPGGRMGEPCFTKDDLVALFESAPLKLTPDAIEMLWGIACLPNHGSLRLCKRLVEVACKAFGRKKKVISSDELDKTLQRMSSDHADRITSDQQQFRKVYKNVKSRTA